MNYLIGGFLKQSFIDYPAKIASVVFLPGCNLRCPYCHNASLVHGETSGIGWDEIRAHLERRRNLIDGVVISGGEPCLHEWLPEMAAEIHALGYLVKLDTNGTRPQLLKRLLSDHLVDYVAMDIKALPERYDRVGGEGATEAVDRSIRLLMDSGIDYQFRTTLAPSVVALDDLPKIARWITGAKQYVLQQFQPSGTLLDARCRNEMPYSPDALREVIESLRKEIRFVDLKNFSESD